MSDQLSPRLRGILDALPPLDGLRVLEVGCGPGALARAIAARASFVLGLDRSATAVRQATDAAGPLVASGRLAFRLGAAEDFRLGPGETPFDIAVAVRVGALDGRHPEAEAATLAALAVALRPGGRLFVDGRERPLAR